MNKPTFEEISEAFSQDEGRGDRADTVPDAFADSPEAAAIWKDLVSIREAARSLPYRVPTSAEVEQQAQLILYKLDRQHARPRWTHALGPATLAAAMAGAAMASIITFLAVRSTDRGEESQKISQVTLQEAPESFMLRQGEQRSSRIAVEASSNAEYEHRVTPVSENRPEMNEVLRIRDGVLVVEMPPLMEPGSLRILTDDAEIAVDAGHVRVSVAKGQLEQILVLSGRADVTYGGQVLDLRTTDLWQRSSAAPAPRATEAPRALETPRAPEAPQATEAMRRTTYDRRTSPSGSTSSKDVLEPLERSKREQSTVDEGLVQHPRETQSKSHRRQSPASAESEALFRVAWEHFESGDFLEAAAGFSRIKSSSLLDEASYWRAVALDRAGRRNLAIEAYQDFLELHPSSPRQDEVFVLLGRVLVRENRKEEARENFLRATKSASNKIREQGEAGLLEAGTVIGGK